MWLGDQHGGRGPTPVVALDDPQRHQRQAERQHSGAGQVGRGGCRRSAAAGRRLRPAQRIAAPSGRLTRKTRRQSTASTRAPPRVGPHRRGRRGRRAPEADSGRAALGGKLSSTIASEVGAISAAPTPCSTRKAISSSSEGAAAQSALASGEAGDTEQEDALVAEAVGEPAGRDEQGGDDDEVAVEHPGERVTAGRRRTRPRCPGRRC